MKQGTILGSQIGRWIILAALVVVLGALLLATQPVFAQATPPEAPTGLRAVATSATMVELYWTAPTNTGGGPITGYKVDWSNDGDDWTTTNESGTIDVAGAKMTYNEVTTGLTAGTTRYFRVRATNMAGDGVASTVVSVTTQTAGLEPAVPTDVSAMANGPSEIVVTWTKPAGSITRYEIEYSKGNADGSVAALPWMSLGTATGTATSYRDTGLDPETKRFYRVAAVNASGRGTVSASTTDSMATTTAKGVPAAPTGLRAVATGEETIELYWTAPDEGGAPISNYKIEVSVDGKAWTGVDRNPPSKDTFHEQGSLEAGNMRYFRVSAINSIGTGLVSEVVNATTQRAGLEPAAPTGVSATANGLMAITVTWTKPAGSITRYEIEYSKGNADGSVAALPWMAAGTATSIPFRDTGLDPNTKRFYRVAAVNANGRGPVSASTAESMATTDPRSPTRPPAAPTGLRAVATSATMVELYWTAPTNTGGGPITGYKVDWSNDGDDWTTTNESGTIDVAGAKMTYNEVTTGLTAGTTRYFRVRATNDNDSGNPSTVVSVTTQTAGLEPAVPTDVSAMANGPSEIVVTWTKPAGSITRYEIEYSKGNADGSVAALPWMSLGTATGTATSYRDTGLDPETKRFYRVAAVNASGRGTVSASTTDSMATTTAKGVPAAPTGLRAVATGEETIELYWTAPDEGGAPISNYKIEVSVDGKAWTGVDRNPPSKDTFHEQGSLEAGNMRYFRVSAINSIGTGLVSEVVNASTQRDGLEPAAPAGVSATQNGSSEIVVTWTKPAGSITRYEIEYSKGNADGSVAALPWMAAGTATGTLFIDTGLDPNTKRFYRVAAVNANGRGPVSASTAESMATTDMGLADQPGTVTLSTQKPMVGTAITASLTDDDGMVSGQMWQWEKSMDKASWMDAAGTGAMTRSYTPAAMDEGYYLRATVTYTDKNNSGRMAYSMATGMVTLPTDREGTVTLNPASPVVGDMVTASVSDPDMGVTNTTWQWASAETMGGTYNDIDNATSASYTPVDDDANMYLRVMATYTDSYRSNRTATSAAVMVTVDDRPQAVRDYDTDGTQGISIDELFDAIDDYFDRGISIDDLFEVIDAYFG